MSSQKTAVFEYLFDKYWDNRSRKLKKTVMSLSDVSKAIHICNKKCGRKLSANNPANFMKDFLRGDNASRFWPESIKNKRYTAVQLTGSGECFQFIPYLKGQKEPFPDRFAVRKNAIVIKIQSISVPLITKTLGRSDETWLIQSAINLKVIETHFAIVSKFPMLELSHLQMGIKLRSAEIDALFLGKYGDIQNPKTVLVTCEAKQSKDRLIPSQIINQVKSIFSVINCDVVIPIGLRAIKNKGFYITEFNTVNRDDIDDFEELELVADAIYELCPAVKGI